MQVHFTVTDFKHEIPVVYDKVLPDLFREGAGVIVHGTCFANGTFDADEVLAKHDENYRPPGIGPASSTSATASRAMRRCSSRRRPRARRCRRSAVEQSVDDPRARSVRADPRDAARGPAGVLRHRRPGAEARALDRRRDAGRRRPVRHGGDLHGRADRLVRQQRLLGQRTSRRIPTPRCRSFIAWRRSGARTPARSSSGSSCSPAGRWRRPSAPRGLPKRFAARVLGVLGVISFGFLLFTLATSNPFLRLDPPWPDGQDLNPILQDPGLAVHPPILYTGYVGLAVAFAFACAAMLEGRLDRGLGALDAALDDGRLGVPHLRHRARQLVGLLHARVGRLLVLGPGGERLLHAVAHGHRAHPFARRDREARALQELDAAAGDARLLAQPASAPSSCAPGVLVSVHSFAADPTPRHVHPGVPRRHDRRRARALRLAGAAAEVRGRLRAHRARVLPPLQQHPAGDRLHDGVRRHDRAAHLRGAASGQAVGRAAVLQSDLPALDPAAAGAAVGRHPCPLEARQPRQRARALIAADADRRCGDRLRGGLRPLHRRPGALADRRRARRAGSSSPR